jgi:hypothetical protein
MNKTREEMQGGGREEGRENGKVLLASRMHLHTLYMKFYIYSTGRHHICVLGHQVPEEL